MLSTVYDARTIQYVYDQLSRLVDANYGDRRYQYAFDRAGNRTQEIVTIGGTPTTTNYTYNAANQISNSGFIYDANGNLTSDGTNTYTWDRANRLLSVGNHSYQYDGEGHRIRKTVATIATDYLLDLQPSLAVVLTETSGSNTTRYVHGPRGIHAQKDPTSQWSWTTQDGLGSVCGVANDAIVVQGERSFAPYGIEFGTQGTFETPYAFTGEPRDDNGLVYLRARYYTPGMGVFTSLDPIEGNAGQTISLNRYVYAMDNPVKWIDPSGQYIGETGGSRFSCDLEPDTRVRSFCNSVSQAIGILGARSTTDSNFWYGKLASIKNCDGSLRLYDQDSGDATNSLQNIFSQDIRPTITWSIATNSPRYLPLAVLEALLLINAKLLGIGHSFTSAYTASITFVPNSGFSNAFQGETSYEPCRHNISLGYQMEPETIVHELGHEFDCRYDEHPGVNALRAVDHFMYYLPDEIGECGVGGQRQTAQSDIQNPDVAIAKGNLFCFVSGVISPAIDSFMDLGGGFGARANADNEDLEVWADMFMNWVYDGTSAVRHDPGQFQQGTRAGFSEASTNEMAATKVRREWMDRKMRQFLAGL